MREPRRTTAPNTRRPYTKPAVTVLGPIAQVTQGGGNSLVLK